MGRIEVRDDYSMRLQAHHLDGDRLVGLKHKLGLPANGNLKPEVGTQIAKLSTPGCGVLVNGCAGSASPG